MSLFLTIALEPNLSAASDFILLRFFTLDFSERIRLIIYSAIALVLSDNEELPPLFSIESVANYEITASGGDPRERSEAPVLVSPHLVYII